MKIDKMKDHNLKKSICDWIIPIFIAVVIAILINRFIVFKIEIPSESMVPTLNVGNKLFASRVYSPENLNRGDLVVFYFEPENKLYIKRLIGLPNDKIIINNGIVSINDEILIENYVKNQEEFNGEYKVPKGKYFFLGDNRDNSSDSRYWKNPYIDSEDIIGKAFIKVYPFNQIGVVDNKLKE